MSTPTLPSSPPLPPLNLTKYPSISESYIKSVDLTYHILSAGNPSNPLILCLHGFPELAYSYRKVLGPIAAAGYYVVAYDQRGYGRTTGWDTRKYSDVDLNTFRATQFVKDAVVLVQTLGYSEVACVIGNDVGAAFAPLCALIRPDLFKSAVVMTHPFKGIPTIPKPSPAAQLQSDIHKELASLSPPRKHYKWHYALEPAAIELLNPDPESFKSFYRGYFHLKSGDWPGNKPQPLKSWTASELEPLPLYYIMPLNSDMYEAVQEDCASSPPSQDTYDRWLSDDELQVFIDEYTRTGFQGSLNIYRILTQDRLRSDLHLFAGKTIDVPTIFISGEKDWGSFQEPGSLEGMEKVCTRFKGKHFIEGAGHWVQQEQPEKVVEIVLDFLKSVKNE